MIGTFLVTVVFNVPLNNALESGADSWSNYYRRWTAWNHLRTIASLCVHVCVRFFASGRTVTFLRR